MSEELLMVARGSGGLERIGDQSVMAAASEQLAATTRRIDEAENTSPLAAEIGDELNPPLKPARKDAEEEGDKLKAKAKSLPRAGVS